MIQPTFFDCVNSSNTLANCLEKYFHLEGWGKRRFELISGTSRVQEIPQHASLITRYKWKNALKITSYCMGGIFLILAKVLYRGINSFQVTNGTKDPTLPIRCKACVDLRHLPDTVLLGEDEKWNREQAPYLYDTISSEKGAPQPGDYLLPIELYDVDNADYTAKELLVGRHPFFLPGSLVRTIKEGDTIRLTYKKQAEIAIKLKEKDQNYDFADLIAQIENRHYYERGGRASQPIAGKIDLTKIKRYPHPEEVIKVQNAVKMNRAMLEIVHSAKVQEHFVYDEKSKSFQKVQSITIPEPGDIDVLYGEYPTFALCGNTETLSISLVDDKLFIYQKRNTASDLQVGIVISNERKDHMVALLPRPPSFRMEKVRFADGRLHLA